MNWYQVFVGMCWGGLITSISWLLIDSRYKNEFIKKILIWEVIICAIGLILLYTLG